LGKGLAGEVRPGVVPGETLTVVHTHPGTRQIVPSREDFVFCVDAGTGMRVLSRGDRANQTLSASFNQQQVNRYRTLLDPTSLDIVENGRTYFRDMVEMYRRWNILSPENLQIQADELGVAWR
jgi:hypothetical protein